MSQRSSFLGCSYSFSGCVVGLVWLLVELSPNPNGIALVVELTSLVGVVLSLVFLNLANLPPGPPLLVVAVGFAVAS